MVLAPRPTHGQMNFFDITSGAIKNGMANAVMDGVSNSFGEFALDPARLLKRNDMPNVIAPAWKPYVGRRSGDV